MPCTRGSDRHQNVLSLISYSPHIGEQVRCFQNQKKTNPTKNKTKTPQEDTQIRQKSTVEYDLSTHSSAEDFRLVLFVVANFFFSLHCFGLFWRMTPKSSMMMGRCICDAPTAGYNPCIRNCYVPSQCDKNRRKESTQQWLGPCALHTLGHPRNGNHEGGVGKAGAKARIPSPDGPKWADRELATIDGRGVIWQLLGVKVATILNREEQLSDGLWNAQPESLSPAWAYCVKWSSRERKSEEEVS